MKAFEELGSAVEGLWKEKNYNEALFPEIAESALREAALSEQVTPWQILRWLHATPVLPSQMDLDGRFGDPPITLYSGQRFYIDIYFWLDGTTDIHQHAFAGAFQVLLGSSLHSRYDFREEHPINDHFSLGRLDFRSVELLEEGDVRQIVPGRGHIHSLFHLDRPSATITIRTHDVASAHPQYSYLKPHLAYNPFFKEPTQVKKLQSLSLLLRMNHSDCESLIAELIANSDFQTTFFILQMVSRHLSSNDLTKFLDVQTGRERFNRLIEKARVRHGSIADLLVPVLDEQERLIEIIGRRSSITGAEHRFFLALLLNVPDKNMVLRLVKQRFPNKNALDTALDWVMDLSTTRVWGSSEPNVLGINGFDNDGLFVLECLLEGLPPEEMERRLQSEYASDYAQSLLPKLSDLSETIRDSTIFRSILGGVEGV